jgi:hypothetical protein
VTPVGDIEVEVVFRIAVRGRASDLAGLLEALNKTRAVVMWLVEAATRMEDADQRNVTTTVGGHSG